MQRLVLPASAIVVASVVIALALHFGVNGTASPAQRAAQLAAMGDLGAADKLYRDELASKVELATLIEFIDNRATIIEINAMARAIAPGEPLRVDSDDAGVLRFVSSPGLGEEGAALARFWYDERLGSGEADATAIVALADRTPPARLANHVLARTAMLRDDPAEAAKRFEREGLAFPREAEGDLRFAFELWKELEAWDELRVRARDPRYLAVSGPRLRLAIAEHDRDWPAVLLWLWPSSFEGVTAWPLGLASLSGVLWFLIAGRLGRVSEPVDGRIALYAAAFALGVLSVYPTLMVITLEEVTLNLRQVGEVVPDAIFFVFGVGLREEACKLLLFLPLLPILRRRGSRLEALTCGALVGLGFAAEENVLYFQNFEASVCHGHFPPLGPPRVRGGGSLPRPPRLEPVGRDPERRAADGRARPRRLRLFSLEPAVRRHLISRDDALHSHLAAFPSRGVEPLDDDGTGGSPTAIHRVTRAADRRVVRLRDHARRPARGTRSGRHRFHRRRDLRVHVR